VIVVVAATLAVCSAQDQQVTVKPLWDKVASVSRPKLELKGFGFFDYSATIFF
jgi:hypothetical protein